LNEEKFSSAKERKTITLKLCSSSHFVSNSLSRPAVCDVLTRCTLLHQKFWQIDTKVLDLIWTTQLDTEQRTFTIAIQGVQSLKSSPRVRATAFRNERNCADYQVKFNLWSKYHLPWE